MNGKRSLSNPIKRSFQLFVKFDLKILLIQLILSKLKIKTGKCFEYFEGQLTYKVQKNLNIV